MFKNSYSLKYFGLGDDNIGVFSKRVNPASPLKSKNFHVLQTKYTVNNHFATKPLRVGKKHQKENCISIHNLESYIRKEFSKKKHSDTSTPAFKTHIKIKKLS